ncbi:hypothetical protein AAY24_11975 [Sedimenticola thiotaurini]|uniref:Uncharacterized protein n=1 Tax=Sedimenticola thiotaurini TaxID=1543721 RepID=A0A0F7JZ32_9GAMM|nr:hypothetical protein AAY24_11975 [Sedimenticola thiotaurini]
MDQKFRPGLTSHQQIPCQQLFFLSTQEVIQIPIKWRKKNMHQEEALYSLRTIIVHLNQGNFAALHDPQDWTTAFAPVILRP